MGSIHKSIVEEAMRISCRNDATPKHPGPWVPYEQPARGSGVSLVRVHKAKGNHSPGVGV